MKDRLKRIREERKMGLVEFTKFCGLSSKSALARWESGGTEPTASDLAKIGKSCDVSIDWLLGLSDKEPARPAVAPDVALGSSDAYWRDLAISQQATIARLTNLLAEGRSTHATPAQIGGRIVTKPA